MPAPTAWSASPCDGRQDALHEAMLANSTRLHALARRMLGDHHAAEDAVQDALLRALQSIDRFRAESSMGTWLYRITANVCLDELRRRRRVVIEATGNDDHDERVADIDFTEAVVTRAELSGALATLPPAQRAALVLTDICGLNYAEAGDALQVPVGTVASRLHRAKATMRTALIPAA